MTLIMEVSGMDEEKKDVGEKDEKHKWELIQFVVFFFFVVVLPAVVYAFFTGMKSLLKLDSAANSDQLRHAGLLFSSGFFGLGFLGMISSRLWLPKFPKTEDDTHTDRLNIELHLRHQAKNKMLHLRSLFARDIGPLTFDVSTHADIAEISEYRGLIHWHRDVIEKLLSVLLTIVFCSFIGRGLAYLVEFLRGSEIKPFLKNDIQTAALIVGFALIIDGILLVAAMTDAPGIGRTLDSLIVVLAGIIILIFDPNILMNGNFTGLGTWLVVTVALLFIVRWVIRHHTINEWMGKKP
jgi:hypothetical protein